MTRCKADTSNTHQKSYFMIDPGSVVTVTRSTNRQKHKVHVALDIYAGYAKDLKSTDESGHLVSLSSKTGSVLFKQKIEPHVKSVLLNPCDYLNLFGSSSYNLNNKAKVEVLNSPPAQATSVAVALIRTGDIRRTDFTEHLKCYFKSPKILFPNHVFAVAVPEKVPPNLDLESWLTHISTKNFVQQTYPVHFRVMTALSGDKPIDGFFYISSAHTTLYEVSHQHCNIPTFVSNKKVDMFYAKEVEMLVKQQQKTQYIPLILSGEKGSCKTEVIQNIAGRLGMGLYQVFGIDYCGEAPGSLEAKFKYLLDQIKVSLPCVVHIDNLELLGRTRDGNDSDPRVILAISQMFEGLADLPAAQVHVIGSCSQPDNVVMPLKHLFSTCFSLQRQGIDKVMSFIKEFLVFENDPELDKTLRKKLKHLPFRKILKFINGLQIQLGLGLNDNQAISLEQCTNVLEDLTPAEHNNNGSIVPETSWQDIGGIDHVRREVEETIEIPLKHAELFGEGVKRSGLLLYGRPGCGKTMVARAIASQCNLSFLSIQGPELLNSFVGQSEDNVRKIFENARAVAPTVIFFDEIDAIAPKRSGGVIDRVLAQLLSEMDGIHEGGDVFMIGATNRPELLDPAIMRPGRLDKRVEVSVGADVHSRVQVFEALSRNLKLAENVCFRTISEMSGNLSGAECYGVLLEACYKAIERCIETNEQLVVVTQNDLVATLMK